MKFNTRHGRRSAPVLPISGSGLVRSGRGPGTVLLLLLFALLVQGTLVQTHLHFAQQAFAPGAAASEQADQTALPDKNDPSAHCRLCQEATMAGAYVLPSATVLPSVPMPASWIAAAAMAGFGLLAPALGWQSRAPPR